MQELRVLRDRSLAAQRDIDSLNDAAPGGSRSLLCKTTTVTTYPTSAGAFYAVKSQSVDGTEAEGASATYSDDTGQVFYAWNAGTQIPPSGTAIVCHAVGGRFVFRFDG